MPIDRKLNNSVIVEGLAEIQVGTARLSSFRPFADGLLNMASGIQPSAPDAEKDIQASAPYEDIDNSESAMSLVSMLSLPPAYCDLRSRSESSFSLETRKNRFITNFKRFGKLKKNCPPYRTTLLRRRINAKIQDYVKYTARVQIFFKDSKC